MACSLFSSPGRSRPVQNQVAWLVSCERGAGRARAKPGSWASLGHPDQPRKRLIIILVFTKKSILLKRLLIFLKNQFANNILFLKCTESSVHQDTGPGYGWRCVRRNLGRYINLLFLPWEISDSTQFVGFKCAVPWYPYTNKHSLKKVIQGKEIVIKRKLRTAIIYFLNLKLKKLNIWKIGDFNVTEQWKYFIWWKTFGDLFHPECETSLLKLFKYAIEKPTNQDRSCLPALLILSLYLKKCI